ncbi:MAG: peptide chain release factor N(5)-glutamine methyltransferase, partial [Planctomycetota bacterium]
MTAAMKAVSQANEAFWTIARLLDWTAAYLAERGVEEARLSAELLLAHALNCRRIDLYT